MSETPLPRHPLIDSLPEALRAHLQAMSRITTYPKGAWLLREGEDASSTFLVLDGRVAIEVNVSGQGAVLLETIEPGGTVGWSWSIAPYKWHFDARAVTETRVLVIDGRRLRLLCDTDPALGYPLLQRFMGVLQQRIESLRLQVLDVYRNHHAEACDERGHELPDDDVDDGDDTHDDGLYDADKMNGKDAPHAHA